MNLNTAVTLRSGLAMPQFGLGTWLSKNKGEAAASVKTALEKGYRMIDTAQMYGNEEDIGSAIKLWCSENPTKEPPFVVTKLAGDQHVGQGSPTNALIESLKRLQMECVDLYLMHSPSGGNCVETWKEMLECKAKGLVKAVGVSNFGVDQLEGIRLEGLEAPEVNQIEFHAWLQQKPAHLYMKEHGIACMGFCPLARCKQFEKTGLVEVAKKRGVSEALMAIRWSLDQGVITIPKSSNPERIGANATAVGLAPLSEEERRVVNGCDVKYRASNASGAMSLPWDEVK
jgi:diketogulonate reductase-like aldo/keto reductase